MSQLQGRAFRVQRILQASKAHEGSNPRNLSEFSVCPAGYKFGQSEIVHSQRVSGLIGRTTASPLANGCLLWAVFALLSLPRGADAALPSMSATSPISQMLRFALVAAKRRVLTFVFAKAVQSGATRLKL